LGIKGFEWGKSHHISAVIPAGGGFIRGIPESWVDEFFKKEGFAGEVIDPENPPTFESETAYLDRHGFLSIEEKKYLAKHPEKMEPEIVRE